MIHTEIKLTAPRYSSAAPTIPTISIWDPARDAAAHRAVMSFAHILAAKLWSWNGAGWVIAVEPAGGACAQLTIETLHGTAAEQQAAIEHMDDAVVALRASMSQRDPAAEGTAAVREDDARRARPRRAPRLSAEVGR